jgi:hypothetical protein
MFWVPLETHQRRRFHGGALPEGTPFISAQLEGFLGLVKEEFASLEVEC